jgi:hypothetical protein
VTTLTDLRSLGFRRIADFQTAWNLGPALHVDGIIGPKTAIAVEKSRKLHAAGKPDISENFSVSEFACHCGGKLTGCRKVLVHRSLLAGLEELRTITGTVDLVCGYRCPKHNHAVGGADDSQHMYGTACDPNISANLAEVKKLKVFSGIGSKRSMPHRVTHVDVRHVYAEHNGTHGRPNDPTLWYYPG